jgi:hypothetical protein
MSPVKCSCCCYSPTFSLSLSLRQANIHQSKYETGFCSIQTNERTIEEMWRMAEPKKNLQYVEINTLEKKMKYKID